MTTLQENYRRKLADQERERAARATATHAAAKVLEGSGKDLTPWGQAFTEWLLDSPYGTRISAQSALKSSAILHAGTGLDPEQVLDTASTLFNGIQEGFQ